MGRRRRINKRKSPRPPDILRKGGPMRDKTQYDRKNKSWKKNKD